MEQDLKQEVQALRNSIDILANEIVQQFSTLNDNLVVNFDQISKQITNLSIQPVLSNKIVDNNLVNNQQENLQKPQTPPKIPQEYFIDFTYINDAEYTAWLSNLKKYSKQMAECRDKNQIKNFCEIARSIMESAIQILLEEEYKYLSESNKSFLEAYDRVKSSYATRRESFWELPEIYINKHNNAIQSDIFKDLGDKYISRQSIDKIRRESFPACVQIFFEILRPNFINTKHFQDKYYLINNISKLRNLKTHGSTRDINSRLDELGYYVKALYNSSEKYTNMTRVVSWFVEEVYKRINKLKHL